MNFTSAIALISGGSERVCIDRGIQRSVNHVGFSERNDPARVSEPTANKRNPCAWGRRRSRCKRIRITELDSVSVDRAGVRRLTSDGSKDERNSLALARAGSKVGRYVIVEPLGAGGMGVVYRAYDPKLRREIALKHIGGRALQHSAERTLVREGRAMAQLRHRHVVSVFDVEVANDGFFLAMELVPGPDARVWLQTPRTPREILDVFVGAGRGLAAAHAAGLVHCDFKPANVLVDPDAGARVSDFGLAKLAGPADSEMEPSQDAGAEPASNASGDDTLAPTFDAHGESHSRLCVGTPRYMAPEQQFGKRVDERADQFAFCVALWEALTGKPPYRGSYKQMGRSKREGPPAWPRTRGVPARVVGAIRRGLAPRPADRWPSMGALLETLEPRRARASGWAVATVAVAGLGFAVGRPADASVTPCNGADALMAETWNEDARQSVRAVFDASERAYAAPVLELTLSRFDRYADAWTDAHRETCEATAVRGEQSERVLDLRMTCLQEQREGFGELVGVLASSGDAAAAHAHRLLGQLPSLERCVDVEGLGEVQRPDDPEDARIALRLEHELDGLRLRTVLGQANLEEARDLLDRALELGYAPLEANARLMLTISLARSRRFTEGAAEGERAWRLALQSDRPLMAARAASIAGVMLSSSDPETGTRLAQAGLDLAIGRKLPQTLLAAQHANLGNAHLYAGNVDLAVEHLRESVRLHEVEDSDGFDLANSLSDLARAVHHQARHDEVFELADRAVTVASACLGPDHPEVFELRITRAGALAEVGRVDEAIEEQQAVLSAAEQALGPSHLAVGIYASNLSIRLSSVKRGVEAEAAARKALEILRARLGDEHGEVAVARGHLGRALFRQERYEEAAAEQRISLALDLERLGPEHRHVAIARRNLAETLMLDDQAEAALPLLDLALAATDAAEEPELRAGVQATRAQCLMALDRRSEAQADVERAWAIVLEPERSLRLMTEVASTYGELLEDDAPAAAHGVRTAAAARCLAANVTCHPRDRGE